MSKHIWKIAVVAVLAIVAVVMFASPFAPDDDTVASNAPEFGSTVKVSDARLVLAPVAGEPARVYFDVTNSGEKGLYITQVTVEHGSDDAMIARIDGPVNDDIANIPVNPGETVSFGPNARQAVLTSYDSSVVPGAKVDMRLTFGTSDSMIVPMEVMASEGLVEGTPADTGT